MGIALLMLAVVCGVTIGMVYVLRRRSAEYGFEATCDPCGAHEKQVFNTAHERDLALDTFREAHVDLGHQPYELRTWESY